MSDVRHAQFLAQRLQGMGIKVVLAPGERAARGTLPLSSTPFRTLAAPFVAREARFYTLGHNRLKFCHPRVFFELPAVAVARCGSAADVEAALRRTWSARLRDLLEAKAWLDELGAETTLAAGGTRLLLRVASEATSSAAVQSTTEIQVPSGGPLAQLSLREPSERRYRPLRHLDHASELELGLSQAISERASRAARYPPPPRLQPAPRVEGVRAARVLLLDDQITKLAPLQAALIGRGLGVDAFHDPRRALEAFRTRSYDLVLSGVHMPRVDGLEFTARLRQLAGIEQLPVILLDERENPRTKRAAQAAGASGYLVKPRAWDDVVRSLVHVLDHTRRRRFVRYPARLPVEVSQGEGTASELTRTIARGGISLTTRREMLPGTVERYRIALPRPLPPIEVDAAVVTRIAQPGKASLQAGLRFVRFLARGEPHWIRLIEGLARRAAAYPRGEPV